MSEASVSAPIIGHRYLLDSELGSGGMGRVYKTLDRLTGQYVALKHVLVEPQELDFASQLSSTADARLALAHEFETLASFRHPNIINVMDYGFDTEKRPYFTMNLIDQPQSIIQASAGKTLEQKLDLLLQVLEALVYIHRRHILHRDLKPNNVLVQDDHVYVLDFGLAIQRGQADSGHISGTLAYIAPEVLRGAMATEASDLYAVGLLAYQMISGRYPYTLENTPAMLQEILYQPADIMTLDISKELIPILGRLLAKQPEDRYQSADEVIEAIYNAVGEAVPQQTLEIRESFLQAAQFVGREAEMRLLVGSLDQLVQGTGSSWLVGGESGVGKSRLIDEIAVRALVNGVIVLRGQAIREAHAPYALWRDALRNLLLSVDPTDEELPLLKLVLPDVQTLIEREAGALPDVSQEVLYQRLALAIEACFRRALEQQPVLLILEDLQWAYHSLPLLTALQRLVTNYPLLIIGTYRDDERPLLPDELPGMEVIALKRLGDKQIAILSRAMLGKAGERPQVINLLQRETEGNIFFLIEVVRALTEETGRMSDIGLTTLPNRIFSGGIQRILEHRIERVPQWAQPVLSLAAVMGRQIDETLLHAAVPEIDVEHWITVCANAAVLDRQDANWRFAHDKLREYLLDQIPEESNANLHRLVAEAIERVYHDQLDERAPALAKHWAEAGDPIKEGYYSFKAAAELLKVSDFYGVREFAQRALELEADQHSDTPRETRAEIFYQNARARYGLGEFQEAGEWYRQTLALFTELNDRWGIAKVMGSIGELDFRQGRYEQAKPIVEQALEIAREIGDTNQVGNSLMSLGIIAAQNGDLLEAKTLFEESLACMQEIGEPISIARALNNLALAYDLLDDIPEARMIHTRALAIRRRINDQRGIAYSLNNLAALAEIEGNYETARRWGMESLAILRSVGEKMSVGAALGQLGTVALKTHDFTAAESYVQEALMVRRELGDMDGVSMSLSDLGDIALARSDHETAWNYYHQALQEAKASSLEKRTVGIFVRIAQLDNALGRYQEALELLLVAQRFNQSRHIPTNDIDTLLTEVRGKLSPAFASEVEAYSESTSIEALMNRLLSR